MQTGIAAMAAAGSMGSAVTPQPRLVKAAHEFEAQMMKELMKPMTGTNSLTGEDGDEDGDSGASGALGQYASEALGRALSDRGGFGIANSIVKDLSHSGNQQVTTPVTQSVHSDTVMRAFK
jgi:Rod binding domain-containing protein